jgi:hypothetical protein
MNKRLLALLAVFVFIGSAYVPSRQVTAKAGGNDRILEKKTFIHYKTNQAKGGGPGKNTGGYYTYIANGLRWKTTEPFVYNPNGSGMDASNVASALSTSMGEWETYGGNIFGLLTEDDTADYNDVSPDGLNTFTFGDLDSTSIIAITNIWGYFSGPSSTRQIIEVDVCFNTGFAWGNADVSGDAVMDLQNIATHEIGHCAGMGDLYKPPAGQETMFGYSSEGETNKRDLYTGDIAGIKNLYQ